MLELGLRLGEILVQKGLTTPAHVEHALSAQVVRGGRLGTNLVELGYVGIDDLAEALGEQHGVPVATEEALAAVASGCLGAVPRNVCEKYRVLPLRLDRQALHLAMHDPQVLDVIDRLGRLLSINVIEPYAVPELRLYHYLEQHYQIARPGRYLREPGPAIDGERRHYLTPTVAAPDTPGRRRDTGPLPAVEAGATLPRRERADQTPVPRSERADQTPVPRREHTDHTPAPRRERTDHTPVPRREHTDHTPAPRSERTDHTPPRPERADPPAHRRSVPTPPPPVPASRPRPQTPPIPRSSASSAPPYDDEPVALAPPDAEMGSVAPPSDGAGGEAADFVITVNLAEIGEETVGVQPVEQVLAGLDQARDRAAVVAHLLTPVLPETTLTVLFLVRGRMVTGEGAWGSKEPAARTRSLVVLIKDCPLLKLALTDMSTLHSKAADDSVQKRIASHLGGPEPQEVCVTPIWVENKPVNVLCVQTAASFAADAADVLDQVAQHAADAYTRLLPPREPESGDPLASLGD